MYRAIRSTVALIGVVCLLTLAVPVAAQTSLKIGVFDPQRLSEETVEGQRAASELAAIRDGKQQEIAGMESSLAALQDQLSKQALSLSIDKRTALQIDIQRKQLGLNNARELAFRELQIDIEAAEAKFNDKLRSVVSQFGRDEGFTLILEAGAVAWSAAAIDVTAPLIDQFDKMFPAPAQ